MQNFSWYDETIRHVQKSINIGISKCVSSLKHHNRNSSEYIDLLDQMEDLEKLKRRN